MSNYENDHTYKNTIKKRKKLKLKVLIFSLNIHSQNLIHINDTILMNNN